MITGNSMAPLLQKGRDAIMVDQTPFSCLKKNDIIVFRVTGNPVSDIVCHRVFKIDRKNSRVFEKGDHYFEVSEVRKDMYVGKVNYILKNGVLYHMNTARNRCINSILGCLVSVFHLKTKIYLLLHRETTIDEMCQDKPLRDQFYTSYRALASIMLSYMKPEHQ